MYVIAQLVGAFIGGVLAYLIFEEYGSPIMKPANGRHLLRDIAGESVGTFILVFGVLIAAHDETSHSKVPMVNYFMIVMCFFVGR